jgi:hypothetical protein
MGSSEKSKVFRASYWGNRPRPYGLSTALYYLHCEDCRDSIEWVCDFDADGSTWGGDCGCPDKRWFMTTETVNVSFEKEKIRE